MPALIDDPSAPTMYRQSGAQPYPQAGDALPSDITARPVTLRDGSQAIVYPFPSQSSVPPALLTYLASVFAAEIEAGDTYPLIEPMSPEAFSKYWLQNFAAIMIANPNGDLPTSTLPPSTNLDWSTLTLGTFYIKPNYPGRSSHICNAGFLVSPSARGKGVGRTLGEAYLDYAPRLGYSYSVFNLVYETNTASLRIWDGLGFERIGRIPRCGNLKSYPGRLVDAVVYGKDLTQGGEKDVGMVDGEKGEPEVRGV